MHNQNINLKMYVRLNLTNNSFQYKFKQEFELFI